jgi:hypothetical protein
VLFLVSCSAAWLAMELMSRWYERQRAAAGGDTRAPRAAGASRERSRG